MKKFVVDENWTIFADLTQISAIRAIEKTVDVMLNDSFHYLVYSGNSHADAADFAEKLAAEVDAAKEAHIENLLKRNSEESAKYACKVINGNATYDDEKTITDICGRTIEPIQISALYINEFGDVRAIIAEDEIVALKHFGNTKENSAYINIDELAKRCNLYTVTKFNLYVDPVSVKKVFIDDGGDDNYKLCVQVYDFDLAAATFDDCNDAITTLKKLKKDFKLE